MCVWQLTFYEQAAEAMGSSGVVQGLVDMARQATKEKVGICSAVTQCLQQITHVVQEFMHDIYTCLAVSKGCCAIHQVACYSMTW